MIRRAETEYPDVGVELAERATVFLDLEAARIRPDALTRPRATGTTRKAVETIAYINQGRWVAECPCSGCASALVVDPADPRYFCPECRNAELGHDYATVVFPAKRMRDAIESILLERPNELHRSWLPHETLNDLRAENALPAVVAGLDTPQQATERGIGE